MISLRLFLSSYYDFSTVQGKIIDFLTMTCEKRLFPWHHMDMKRFVLPFWHHKDLTQGFYVLISRVRSRRDWDGGLPRELAREHAAALQAAPKRRTCSAV